MTGRSRFTLLIEDAGGADDPPVAIRLRQALKRMLRGLGFRCVAIAEIGQAGAAADAAGGDSGDGEAVRPPAHAP